MNMLHSFARRAWLTAVVVGAGLLAARAQAATEYFDVNGTTAGSGVAAGGSYTWETSSWNSNNSAGTAATHSWVEGDVAKFSAGTDANGKAYTITANSNHTITGIQVNANGGGTVTVNGPGILTISNLNTQPFYVGGPAATTSLKINAVLTGPTGVRWLSQSGGGSLYLYGANTFNGTSEIDTSQPLYFNNAQSFGTSNLQFSNDATISNPDTTGPLTIPNHVLMSNARINYSGHDPVTFSGSWSLDGSLSIGNSQFPNSKLILNGQLFNGALRVDSAYDGVLVLGNPNPPSSVVGPTTIGGSGGGLPVLQAIENQGLPSTRILLNGGVLQGTSAFSNTFTRPLGSSGKSIYWGDNGGGFAQLTVNLGGDGRELVWGTAIGTEIVGPLKFGSASAAGYTLFQNAIDLNGEVRTIFGRMANTQMAAEMAGVIRDSGTGGGLTKTGPATISLKAQNTYAGTTTINEGTLWANDGLGLPAASFLSLDGGVLGSYGNVTFTRPLGTNGNAVQWTANGGGFSGSMTVNIGGAGAELVWGTAVGSQIVGPLKFGNGGFSGTTSFVNGIDLNDTGTAAGRTIDVGGGTSSIAQLSGVIRNSGAAAGVTKTGTGKLILTGANTYTGGTTISDGVLSVPSLADGGAASGIGQSTNDAANLILNGGTLQYTGAAQSTDRLFTLGTGATAGTIDASGTGALVFVNTGAMATTGTGIRTLTLAGTNTGDNTMSLAIGNEGGNATSLTKSGTGRWVLPTANPYSGTTTVSAGTLAIGSDGSLGTGQLRFAGGTIASSGGARSIANDVVLAGTAAVGGAADFTFHGSLTTSGSSRALTVNNSGTTTLAGPVSISDNATDRTLTITSNGNTLVPSVIANGGTSTAGRLSKGGSSTLTLSGNNTYAGKTTIGAGTLVAASLNKVVGGNATSNLGAPTNVADGTIGLGGTTSTGTLRYVGPGETTDRVVDLGGTTGGGGIDASGTGPLSFSSAFTATGAGSKTLTLQGTNTGDNTIAGAIVDNSATNRTSLMKSDSGKWILSGANTYSGGTTVSGGTLAVSGAGANLSSGNVTIQGTTAGTALMIQSGVTNAVSDTAILDLLGGGSVGVADQGYIELGADVVERVGSLQLNDIAQARGITYGSSASSAILQSDEYFAGLGLIQVGDLGDFNGDFTVNNGDFVVWSKNRSAYGGSAGYDVWRANFGRTWPGFGSGLSPAGNEVPEPSSLLLLVPSLLAIARRHRVRSDRSSRCSKGRVSSLEHLDLLRRMGRKCDR